MYRFIQNIGDYFNPGYFTEDFKTNVFATSGYDSEAVKEFNKRFSGLRQKYFDYKQSIIEPGLHIKYVLKHTHDFHTTLLQTLGYDTRNPYSQWLYLDDDRVVPVRHILKEGNKPELLIMEMQPMIQRGDEKTEGLFEQQYSNPPSPPPSPLKGDVDLSDKQSAKNGKLARYDSRQWSLVWTSDAYQDVLYPQRSHHNISNSVENNNNSAQNNNNSAQNSQETNQHPPLGGLGEGLGDVTISPKVINEAIEEIFYLPEDQRPHYIIMLAGNYVYLLEEKQFKNGRYLVFDLEELFAEVSIPANRDYYALFYLLCSKQSLAPEDGTPFRGTGGLMDKLEEESTKNAFSVTKDLKEGVIHAIEALGNEAVYYIHEVLQSDIDETDEAFEQNVKDDCITIVYRLLFIFYAEARPELGILPMDNPVYVNGYSLDKLRDLETVDMQKPATQNGYFIHDSLWRLFSMIHTGYPMQGPVLCRPTKNGPTNINRSNIVSGPAQDRPLQSDGNEPKEEQSDEMPRFSRTFSVKKIDSPLFDDKNLKVLGGVKFRNVVWQGIIRELSITKPDSKHKTVGRISYANLGINQLGSVYESLLAYRGFYAEQDYMEVFKAGAEKDGTYLAPASRADDFHEDEKKYNQDGNLFTIPKGTFIYRLNGRDRKKSASFYTPEVLTQSTVKYTLKGFVDRLNDPNDPFCAQDLLKLKILEPAMGAAAFQNECIDQLAELYISQREKELGKHVSPTSRRDEVQKVKAYIATHNVYGVDLNPTAIELGKLSLWLNVIHRDMETPFFSNRLALGNAVLGAWLKVYSRDDVVASPCRGRSGAGPKKNGITLIPKSWWEKSPHKIKFFKNRVNRGVNDVYHFLLPDKNMLGVLKINEQKKAYPDKVKHMNKILKDWTAPIKESDFKILQKLSDKIDILLKEYFNFQRSIEALTNNKTDLWGVFGETTIQYDKAENYAEKERLNDTRYRHDNAYFRLKMVMDYWCALWFWDYDHVDDLPTRADFWNDIEAMLNVSDEAINKRTAKAVSKVYVDHNGQLGLFPEGHMNDLFYQPQLDAFAHEDEPGARQDEDTSEVIVQSKEEILSETKGKGRTFFDDSMRFKYAKKLADRYHFFHPMLEFIEVFWLRDGFDIILGNPPWIKLEFDEQGIISERFPEVAIRKMSAPDVRRMRDRLFRESPEVEKLYHDEETENAGDAAFMNAYCNYPLLIGQQTNLYKCILENGLGELSNHGFMGMLHPESIYDDPKGQPLRRAVYHHLRYHFQYQNELSLFAEVHHETKYGENIYGPYQENIHFASISNLFTPITIDGCFDPNSRGLCGGIKDKNGKWNVTAHKDRIVWFGEKELKVLADAFENGTDWESVKLSSIHSESIMEALEDLSEFPTHIKDFYNLFKRPLDETNDQKAGKIVRNTCYPKIDEYQMIYSGPHISICNPIYKSPRALCKLNSDYDVIDLSNNSSEFPLRTNYVPNMSIFEWKNSVKGFKDGDSYENWVEYYKLGFKEFVGSSSERTLCGAILFPKASHINTIESITFKDPNLLVESTGLCASLVLDFYIKITGSSHVSPNRIDAFPLGIADKYKSALFVRTLQLNCLTKYYADLWEKLWRDEYKDEQWSIDDQRLKPFSGLKKEWEWATPLRNYFERRQALVEIDVISAMALGLSLKDLEMIYTIQFPVLQQNEADTWYDSKGNIVFTCSKGLTGVGCDRKEWESIRGKASPSPSEGENVDNQKSKLSGTESYDGNGEPYVHTIDPKKSELYGGQQVTYYPPYTRPDRIADYRKAWAFFEHRFNGV